jgi:hypothetical protein
MTKTNRRADRELLLALCEALSISKGRIRRDPCGDWIIEGLRGHILTDGVDAFAFIAAGTARRWERTKRVLNFMTMIQNGDEEGILKLGCRPRSRPLRSAMCSDCGRPRRSRTRVEQP